jgi:hypothetical protein
MRVSRRLHLRISGCKWVGPLCCKWVASELRLLVFPIAGDFLVASGLWLSFFFSVANGLQLTLLF